MPLWVPKPPNNCIRAITITVAKDAISRCRNWEGCMGAWLFSCGAIQINEVVAEVTSNRCKRKEMTV